jgi:hypothetical protein
MFCLILSSVCSHRLLFLEFNLRADGISLQERRETGGFHQFQLTNNELLYQYTYVFDSQCHVLVADSPQQEGASKLFDSTATAREEL